LNSESKLLSVIEKELSDIRDKDSDKRRTTIVQDGSKADISEEDLIVEVEVVINITHHQFIKSIPIKSYNKSNLDIDTIVLLDKDYIEYMFETYTDYRLLLFTNQGNCYGINCHDSPEGKWRDRGEHLSTVL